MVDFLLFPLGLLAWIALSVVMLAIGGEIDRQRRNEKRPAPPPSVNAARIARFHAETAD